jgi:DNA-binding beta-propeller fold protein YncE
MKNPTLLFLSAAVLASPLLADLPRGATVYQFDAVEGVSGVLAHGSSILVSDQERQVVSEFEASGASLGELAVVGDDRVPYPAGMDVDAQGRVVLAQKDPCQVVVYDAAGSPAMIVGAKPERNPGGDPATAPYLDQPTDVAVGPDGRIYVADTAHNRIAIFSGEDGRYLGAWGTLGYSGEYELAQPMGVAVAGGKVYVADAGNARVMIYDLDGTFIAQLGQRGVDTEGFDSPFDVAVDGAGNIWVADNGLQKLLVFDPEHQLLKAYGLPGDALAFEDLSSLYTAADGTVYLGDGYSGRVFAFETGVAYTRVFDPKAPPVASNVTSLVDARVAFGPVPLRAGAPLILQLPFNADRIQWEVLGLDMRTVARGDERNSALASADTAGMASGVYLVRTRVQVGSDSRQEIQKIIVTR